MAKSRTAKSTHNSGDRRRLNKGRVENLKPFKPGQSGNPGGRPKLLSNAYKEWLAAVNENDPQGRTNAELVAVGQGVAAIKGETSAAREIRQATEGDRVNLQTWQSELVSALQQDKLTAAELVQELGLDDARPILIAAGQAVPESLPTQD